MTENVPRTRDDLVARLRRAGELQVSGDNQAELDSYFDTRQFRFHGPDGFETDYAGLANYFKAVRAAFDDRSIRRGIVVAEANYIAPAHTCTIPLSHQPSPGPIGGRPWWAHFEFTRINIEPIILRKKIEDWREARAWRSLAVECPTIGIPPTTSERFVGF
jgi:hypothetical protein